MPPRPTVANVAPLTVHDHKFCALQTLNTHIFLSMTEKGDVPMLPIKKKDDRRRDGSFFIEEKKRTWFLLVSGLVGHG